MDARPVPPTPLHFQHTVIAWNTQVRYLGLQLDPKLLFTKHLTSLTHKATAIFLQLFPHSNAIQRYPFQTISLCTNYVSALRSHTLPPFGATHHPPTMVI